MYSRSNGPKPFKAFSARSESTRCAVLSVSITAASSGISSEVYGVSAGRSKRVSCSSRAMTCRRSGPCQCIRTSSRS